MTRTYLWEQPGWPALRYDSGAVLAPLAAARRLQGELLGFMSQAGFEECRRAALEAFTSDAVDTSKIEGENVDAASVRSSIARRLGLPAPEHRASGDRMAQGVAEVTMDAATGFAKPLTEERLFEWHERLLGAAPNLGRIVIGNWRNDAYGRMTIQSGRAGRERIHFVAPPAEVVPAEMRRFLEWFQSPPPELDGLLRAAMAHLWFVTIHPFDDGNGRIGRAISDLALAQDEKSPVRFYSLTKQIWLRRRSYYEVLERTQVNGLDVTEWLLWFLECYGAAIGDAQSTVGDVLAARRFWQKHAEVIISPRQRVILERLLHRFEGKLTAKKYAVLAKISVSSATRDINDLIEKGVLSQNEGGSKNTSYSLVLED